MTDAAMTSVVTDVCNLLAIAVIVICVTIYKLKRRDDD